MQTLTRRFIVLAACAGLASSPPAMAQQPTPQPEDVDTIDSIVDAWYDIVSVAPGEQPDWARDSTLYLPDVRFVTIPEAEGGEPVRASVMSHDDFIRASSGLSQGFVEREIHRTTQRFGNMAHVFSTYEFRRTVDGPILGRGINSIQLFHDGARWWIVGAAWRNETEETPIPSEFLP